MTAFREHGACSAQVMPYEPTPEALQMVDQALVLLASPDSRTRAEGVAVATRIDPRLQHRRRELEAALELIAADPQEQATVRVCAAGRYKAGLSLLHSWMQGADPELRRWSRLAMSKFVPDVLAIPLWRTRGLVDPDPGCRLSAVVELSRIDPEFDPVAHLEELIAAEHPHVRDEALQHLTAWSLRAAGGA